MHNQVVYILLEYVLGCKTDMKGVRKNMRDNEVQENNISEKAYQSNTRMRRIVAMLAQHWPSDALALVRLQSQSTLCSSSPSFQHFQVCARCHYLRAMGDCPQECPAAFQWNHWQPYSKQVGWEVVGRGVPSKVE